LQTLLSDTDTPSERLTLPAASRRFPILLTLATVLGLWFGVTAPQVSPVAPAAPVALTMPAAQIVP
jgi:hypothetical protein